MPPKLWKYISKLQQNHFYDSADDPDKQSEILAEGLNLPEYKGDARSAIKLDFCSYNLSFAKEAGFDGPKTSAFMTIVMDLLEPISAGASVDVIKEEFKNSLLSLLSVKAAGIMEWTEEENTRSSEAEAIVVAAQQELNDFVTPPAPPTPPVTKKGKAPEPPPEPEPPDPEQLALLEGKLKEAQENHRVIVEAIEAAHLTFSPPDVKKITEYFTKTMVAHIKLYQNAFTREQEPDITRVIAKVETCIPIPPLSEGRTEEEIEEMRQAEEQAKAEAEAEAARVAEEERLAAEQAAIEAEEERKRLAEEELRARQPTSLDDAVEKAVSIRLLDEKAKLQAEYAAREEQLLQKIRNIEAKLSA